MSVLLDLPQDLIVCLISEWLEDSTLITYYRLDVAVTHHPHADQLHETLRTASLTYEILDAKCFPWLLRREVNVCEVQYSRFSFQETKEWNENLVEIFFTIVNSFKSLKRIYSLQNNLLHRYRPSILNNLTKLCVLGYQGMDELQYIKDHCRNLQVLLLTPIVVDPQLQSLLCDIIDQNPGLTFFRASSVDKSILTHLKKCRGINHVGLVTSSIDESDLQSFIENTSVETITVECPDCYYYSYQAENAVKYLEIRATANDVEQIFSRFKGVQYVKLSFINSAEMLTALHTHNAENLVDLTLNCLLSCDRDLVFSSLTLFPNLKQLCIIGIQDKYHFPVDIFSDLKPNLLGLTLVDLNVDLRTCIDVIEACPVLTNFILHQKFDAVDDGADGFIAFIEEAFKDSGRKFVFDYNYEDENILRYENEEFSGRLVESDTESEMESSEDEPGSDANDDCNEST